MLVADTDEQNRNDLFTYILNEFEEDENITDPSYFKDYETAYESAEKILMNNGCYTLSFEEYMNFFKAITDKYPIDPNTSPNYYSNFLEYLLNFIGEIDDPVLKQLLNDPDVYNYFNQYIHMIDYKHLAYNKNIYEFLLELPNVEKNILNSDLMSLSKCICPICLNRKDVQGTIYIPQTILENKDFIKRIAHTFDFNLFHNTIENLSIKNDASNLLEEHLKFCDKLIADIIPESNYIKDIEYYEAIDSDFIYTSITDEKELKDLIINTTISRFFQTGPYNFLIDLKSFLDYINDDNRLPKYSFPNKDLYTKIVNYQDYSLQELIDLYHSLKDSHIMEEFYDDWNLAKDEFVEELNSKIITRNNMPPKDKKLSKTFGVDIYNLNECDHYLLIHDTSIEPNDKKGIKLIKKKQGVFGRTCLSVQDQNHLTSLSSSLGIELSRSIKLVFEHLDSHFLTFIYPEDAFSTSLNHSDPVYNTPRKIFPLKTLMDYTNSDRYNELTYYTSTTEENGIEEAKSPLSPIAILCEDDISPNEVLTAHLLKVPIIYRETNILLQNKEKIKNKSFQPIKYKHPN